MGAKQIIGDFFQRLADWRASRRAPFTPDFPDPEVTPPPGLLDDSDAPPGSTLAELAEDMDSDTFAVELDALAPQERTIAAVPGFENPQAVQATSSPESLTGTPLDPFRPTLLPRETMYFIATGDWVDDGTTSGNDSYVICHRYDIDDGTEGDEDVTVYLHRNGSLDDPNISADAILLACQDPQGEWVAVDPNIDDRGKVRVSADDTTKSFLEDAFSTPTTVAGTTLGVTQLTDDEDDETLQGTVSATEVQDEATSRTGIEFSETGFVRLGNISGTLNQELDAGDWRSRILKWEFVWDIELGGLPDQLRFIRKGMTSFVDSATGRLTLDTFTDGSESVELWLDGDGDGELNITAIGTAGSGTNEWNWFIFHVWASEVAGEVT